MEGGQEKIKTEKKHASNFCNHFEIGINLMYVRRTSGPMGIPLRSATTTKVKKKKKEKKEHGLVSRYELDNKNLNHSSKCLSSYKKD